MTPESEHPKYTISVFWCMYHFKQSFALFIFVQPLWSMCVIIVHGSFFATRNISTSKWLILVAHGFIPVGLICLACSPCQLPPGNTGLFLNSVVTDKHFAGSQPVSFNRLKSPAANLLNKWLTVGWEVSSALNKPWIFRLFCQPLRFWGGTRTSLTPEILTSRFLC